MNLDERREKVAQMSKSVFQYCLSRTSSYQESADLSQEILLTLCESIDNLRDERAFYAFVWRTADNILKGWYRSKNKRNTAELDDTISDNSWEQLAEQAQENEQITLITRELALLNSNYRRTMIAYYVEGLPIKEISARFSLTQSMVKYLLFQSRKRIKEGVTMDRNFGKLSYDPIELSLFFWGGKNNYRRKFDSKIRQNILMCCYYEKQTEEQIALQLGVPTAYLEDDLKELIKYDLLTEKNGFYLTNIPIITNEVFDEIRNANKTHVKNIAECIKNDIDEMTDEVRTIGFYGSDMPQNQLRWMLTSLILHLAYIDMAQGEQPLDFPTDVFGEKCFRFFTEKSASDPYSVGTSASWSKNNMILFWDVLINGDMLHPRLTRARTDMLCSLPVRQPQTDNEKLVCSELIELGLALKTDSGILPNFPCLTKDQGDKLNEMILTISYEICHDLLPRTDTIRKILIDHTPAHLEDYVGKMAILLHFNEPKEIIQELCENGWLLPMNGGMSATTIMYLE